MRSNVGLRLSVLPLQAELLKCGLFSIARCYLSVYSKVTTCDNGHPRSLDGKGIHLDGLLFPPFEIGWFPATLPVIHQYAYHLPGLCFQLNPKCRPGLSHRH